MLRLSLNADTQPAPMPDLAGPGGILTCRAYTNSFLGSHVDLRNVDLDNKISWNHIGRGSLLSSLSLLFRNFVIMDPCNSLPKTTRHEPPFKYVKEGKEVSLKLQLPYK
jgi:hypothetical protein